MSQTLPVRSLSLRWPSILLFVLWLTDAAFAADNILQPIPAKLLTELPGSLVLCGDDKVPDVVRSRFVELAGGEKSRLVIVSGEEADKALVPWKALKTAATDVIHVSDPKKAIDADFAKALAQATGVWLDGSGRFLRDPTFTDELRRLLERGGVVGAGASGSASLGELVIESNGVRPRTSPGLGLLPGVVIESHFYRQNRGDRLQTVLARQPGLVGLGVVDGTAAIVKGRRLRVLGASYVSVCLAASPQRPASIQTLKADEQADLIALRRAAFLRTQPPFPPAKAADPVVPKGTLIIGGGGGMPMEVWKRFIELAGGPEALIVVVPTANEDPVPADPSEARALRKAGATNVKIFHTRKRSDADSPEFTAVLKEAKGIWFTGGRQWHFVDSYQDTLAERLFHDVLRRGGVIGGSSAGASIQSEYMPRGHPLGNLVMMAEGYERGLGFLPGVAVDQHFFRRKRTQDMTELVTAYPQLLGIGIDEGTVIVVHDSVMEVVGQSKVAVYDRRKPIPTEGKDYEELPAGARYDLKKRQRLSGE
jgi:cyanophycinase